MSAATNARVAELLDCFRYAHLPANLQIVSRPFCELAHRVISRFEGGLPTEVMTSLESLLIAKDAAVRSQLKPNTIGNLVANGLVSIAFIGREPSRGSEQASGWDLYPLTDVTVPARSTIKIEHDLRIQPLSSFVDVQIRPRSGLSERGIVANLGTVDCDYTGPLKTILHNLSDVDVLLPAHKAIAQLVIGLLPAVAWIRVEALTETERGAKGFGSTDKPVKA